MIETRTRLSTTNTRSPQPPLRYSALPWASRCRDMSHGAARTSHRSAFIPSSTQGPIVDFLGTAAQWISGPRTLFTHDCHPGFDDIVSSSFRLARPFT